MSQSLKYAGIAVGFALLAALGWEAASLFQRPRDEHPIPIVESDAPQSVAPTVEPPPAPDLPTRPPTPAAVRPTVPVPAPAPVARGKIIDVSKNPAFAGLSATPVTLDLDDAAPEPAMQALYQALGVPLPPNGRAATFLYGIAPTTLHLHNAPYLEAVLEFAAQARSQLRTLTPQMLEYSPISTSAMVRDQTSVGVWCLAGPFAISVDSIGNFLSFPVGAPPTHTTTIVLTTYAEPGVAVAQYPHVLNVTSFVDEKDQTLTLSPPQNMGAGVNRTPSTAGYTLQVPATHGGRIALLAGTAPFTLLTGSTSLETPVPPIEPITRTIAGMTVEILAPTGAAATSRIPSVTIRFSRGEMPLERWQQLAPALAAVPVQAFGGQAPASPPNVRPENTTNGRGAARQPAPTPDIITMVATFGRSNTAYPAADRAVFSIPTATREVPVPFEFKDLVLP